MIWRILKALFCSHEYRFYENIYGDAIIALGGRSLWLCPKCQKPKIRQYLIKDFS